MNYSDIIKHLTPTTLAGLAVDLAAAKEAAAVELRRLAARELVNIVGEEEAKQLMAAVEI